MSIQAIWNRCKRFFKGSRLLTVGQIVAVFAVGFVLAWIWSASKSSAEKTTQIAAREHEEAAAKKWTCSMHPQIQKEGPGKCPLCGMDLIPVTAGKVMGLRFLAVTPEARELMNVEVAPVERRYVEAEVPLVGKVAYDETRMKYITAWVSGRLDRLYVDYTGIDVKQGDHMVYIYSEELYSAQQELIVAARAARKGPRERSILDTGGVDLLASARDKLRLLGLTEKQIADIEKRDKPSDHVMIYAPIGGTVVQKLKDQGDRVKVGDRIYGIADLTHVWVKLDAYESDLDWVRYGQKVEITTEAYSGVKPLEGRIAFIQPVLNDKTRTVKVRVNVDNKEGRLKPEMFVHGVVRAKVAGKGRVIDPGLAGKWISPMHPEIVRDKPGKCPICGMPLVQAESLGYVVPTNESRPPLVIPVSAALKTGTRAVVYVELPRFPRAVLDEFQHLGEVMAGAEIKEIRAAFDDLHQAADEPNALLRTPYAVRLWKKYAGRIREEAAIGRKAAGMNEAQMAFNATKKALERLQEHFAPAGRPTFAGRQIVLGPRAGDYYLVRHGLAEGELVVTRGNFKIDSALQIQARPSMMTPEGGGGGGHAHGGHGGAKKTAPSEGAGSMELPLAMRRTLYHIMAVALTIDDFLKRDNLQAAKIEFAEIASLLREIDDDLLTGHARMEWNELRMLLGNDVYEGSTIEKKGDTAERIAEARRILARLQHTLQRVERQFGLSPGDHGPQHYNVPPEFQDQLAGLWKAYTSVSTALAADDPQAAAEHTAEFESALGRVDMKLLSDRRAHVAWMRQLGSLKEIVVELAVAKDLKTQRARFSSLSSVMQTLAVSFGFGPDNPVYRHHCEMAFSRQGASWLQPDDKTRNPYFGAAMPSCAQQVELIAGKKDETPRPRPESPPHE